MRLYAHAGHAVHRMRVPLHGHMEVDGMHGVCPVLAILQQSRLTHVIRELARESASHPDAKPLVLADEILLQVVA